MISTIIKHYLYDIGVSILFDNISSNFIESTLTFYDRYSKYQSMFVIIYLSNSCVYCRKLPIDAIYGIVTKVTDDTMAVWMDKYTSDKMGYDGTIYLYDRDIYKLIV